MQFAPSAVPETPPELQPGTEEIRAAGIPGIAQLFSGFTGQGQETPAPVEPPTAISAPPMPEPIPQPEPIPPMPQPEPMPQTERQMAPIFSDFAEDLIGINNEAGLPEEQKERLRRDAVNSLIDEISIREDMGEQPYQNYAPVINRIIETNAPETTVSYTYNILESKGVDMEETQMGLMRSSPIDDLLVSQGKQWTADDRRDAFSNVLGWSKDDSVTPFEKMMSLWSSGKDWVTQDVAREQGVSLQSANAQKLWNKGEAQKRDQYDIQMLNGTYTGDYGSYLRDVKLWTPEEQEYQVSLLLAPAVKNGMLDLWTGEAELIKADHNTFEDMKKNWLVSQPEAGIDPVFKEGVTQDQMDKYFAMSNKVTEEVTEDSEFKALTNYLGQHPFRGINLMQYKAKGTDYEGTIANQAYSWMLKHTDISELNLPGANMKPGAVENPERRNEIMRRAGFDLLTRYYNEGQNPSFIYEGNLPGSLKKPFNMATDAVGVNNGSTTF